MDETDEEEIVDDAKLDIFRICQESLGVNQKGSFYSCISMKDSIAED